jgi:photosystem II stability/assembly factor-like uncharacterized protein
MPVFEGALFQDMGSWELLGPIHGGGTVVGLAISPVRDVLGFLITPTSQLPLYWAATASGVYRSYTSGLYWAQYVAGLTTPLLSSLAVAMNGALFAGAFDGSLHFSMDFGKSWKQGRIPEELIAPVNALAVSPDFRKDNTAFGATAGSGVLATRDGGRTWEAASSGLIDLTILSLAVSPDWSHQQTLFAGSSRVSESTDAGRTWRDTELVLDGDGVSALAVSPAFEDDGTVYAGTEAGHVFRSPDGGRHWERLPLELDEGSVNCLWLAPDFGATGRMIAAVGTTVQVSSDRGQSWSQADEMPGSILAMAGDERSVLAGVYDAGVWESLDAGATWKPATGDLSARAFGQIIVSGHQLYAWGPHEGVWVSDNAGKAWRTLPELQEHVPLTATWPVDGGSLLVSTLAGDVMRSTDGGTTWRTVAHVPAVRCLLVESRTGHGWMGTSDGRLLASYDGGATWEAISPPCRGEEILSIAASPNYEDDGTLLMASAVPSDADGQSRLCVWCSMDSGATWQQIACRQAPVGRVDIAFPSGVTADPLERAVVSAGPLCLHPVLRGSRDAVSVAVDPCGANILSMVAVDDVRREGELYASTASGVFRSTDSGQTWGLFDAGLSGVLFVSLAVVPAPSHDSLYALSLGGLLFRRDLA